MKNWQSSLGGAFSALGTGLMAVGILPQLSGSFSQALSVIALVGFICKGLGDFFGHLFAADAKTVSDLADRVDANSEAIVTGDTNFLARVQPMAATESTNIKDNKKTTL